MTSFLKWIAIFAGFAVAAVWLLNFIGGSLLEEAIQDVSLPDVGIEKGMPSARLGKMAPDFELPDLDGKKIKLSGFRGGPVAVTFWTTWNDSATLQIKIFDDYLRKTEKPGFALLAVASQEKREAVLNFMRRGGYGVPVLVDEPGAVSELYKARTLPVTYFIDAGGMAREVFTGTLSESALVEKVRAVFR